MARKRTQNKKTVKKRRKKAKFKFLYVNGKLRLSDLLLVVILLSLLFVQFIKWSGVNNNTQMTKIEDVKKEEFVEKIAPIAQDEQRKYHIFASITIAQAALESNWGQSELATQYYNLFGVKSDTGGLMTTKEYVNGQWIVVRARFAIYQSWRESIEQHTALLVNGTSWDSSHYQAVISANNYEEAAQALQQKGYATDPNYAQKLISLIKTYNLDKYDNN